MSEAGDQGVLLVSLGTVAELSELLTGHRYTSILEHSACRVLLKSCQALSEPITSKTVTVCDIILYCTSPDLRSVT